MPAAAHLCVLPKGGTGFSQRGIRWQTHWTSNDYLRNNIHILEIGFRLA